MGRLRGVSAPLSSPPSPPPLLEKERGIKRVPRKIEDFSGCLKGVRLINNLFNLVDTTRVQL
jgi:hypothetical protein